MRTTGIVRPVDRLGRIVIPIELRRNLNIEPDDELEIFVDGDYIMLRKIQAHCVFCGSTEVVHEFRGKHICKKCAKEIHEG